MLRAAVLTVSDKSFRGLREDLSGPALTERLRGYGIEVIWRATVPDDETEIREALINWCDEHHADLILTTGGTGLSPRDLTPEATAAVLDRVIPGIGEAMRIAGLQSTPRAMISRAMAGVRGRTLIINLPGSPKGSVENLNAVLPVIEHAVAKIKGDPSDCAA